VPGPTCLDDGSPRAGAVPCRQLSPAGLLGALGLRTKKDSTVMTADKLKGRVDDLRSCIVAKLAELEGEPEWGDLDARERLNDALNELSLQIENLREVLAEKE
jgi:hypothetical protein